MKPITSPELTALEIIIIIVVAIALYWVGPRVVMWLTRHAFVTTYQRTLPKKDLEKRHKTLGGLFANVWRIIVVVIAGYAIFTHFFNSAALAPLFASAGIIGVAFGFGAQSLVKDFLSGVFIISENQYRVGDIIEIDGIRVRFDDGWALVRASNTTPVIVTRFEASSPEFRDEMQRVFLGKLENLKDQR